MRIYTKTLVYTHAYIYACKYTCVYICIHTQAQIHPKKSRYREAKPHRMPNFDIFPAKLSPRTGLKWRKRLVLCLADPMKQTKQNVALCHTVVATAPTILNFSYFDGNDDIEIDT